MFSSKFASTLSKALAARSSAEITAAVATAVAVATVATNNNNINATESSSEQQQEQNASMTDTQSRQQQQQQISPILQSVLSALTAPNSTHCEALLPQHHPPPGSNTAPKAVISRLARRRTIHKLQATKTQASLADKYLVDLKQPPLGEGAFGAVHIARHRQSGEWVAIKKIPKNLTSDATFQHEMEALLHIRQHGRHPNICGLRENFEEGPYYYLVLDLVSGGEMFDHLCQQGPYSEADAARLVREVASALAFCHGIGLVHGDLKPENLMLSSDNPIHASIKLVDFGCAQVTKELDVLAGEEGSTQLNVYGAENTIANTPAYCPREILDPEIRRSRGMALYNKLEPSFDMWAMGVILYIMLTGVHPFDVEGTLSDQEIEEKIIARQAPPLRNSRLTAHLSESAISLIEQLMQWEPEDRLTAYEMLEHPWVTGETARTGKMADSDKKLSSYKAFKSKLEAKVFADMVQWADNLHTTDPGSQQTSLLERAFHNLDGSKRGYITKNDLRRLSGQKDDKRTTASPSRRTHATSATTTISEDDESSGEHLSLSVFSELLSDSLKSRYFPKGHIVYRENDIGDKMYFLNSGTVEVLTSDGHRSIRTQGDTFGEGALLHDSRRNTSTIKCATPVHAIEISRQYFEKFLNSEENHTTKIHLSEKDKTRKRERAQQVLRNEPTDLMEEVAVAPGQYLFRENDPGKALYILEEGQADVLVGDQKLAFSLRPGEMCGDHTVAFGRPRNTSTICASPKGCIFRAMNKEQYDQVLGKNPWWVKKSLRDLSLRRYFLKAIVSKTNMAFPATDERRMREVFDIADVNKSGKLELDNIREMIHAFDKSFTDAEIKEILDALDLDETGAVTFEEFRRMFSARPTMPIN